MEEYSWLVVPMMLVAVVVVTAVGGLALEILPKETTKTWPALVFVAATLLATVLATAVIMFVSINWLGCCNG